MNHNLTLIKKDSNGDFIHLLVDLQMLCGRQIFSRSVAHRKYKMNNRALAKQFLDNASLLP
jgi:hypothetical protein